MDLTPKLITLEESDMSTETVAAGQKFTATVHVASSDCTLCWNFKTEHHDIGFSLHREDSPEEKIFEVPKCDSHLVLQKGVLNSPEPGDCEWIRLFYCGGILETFEVRFVDTVFGLQMFSRSTTPSACSGRNLCLTL